MYAIRSYYENILVRFEVEDTGVGMPEDTTNRVFNAFEQADNSTTRKYSYNFV